jgi:RNA-directed DNA polymerase
MTESPSSLDISTKLERIAKQAREIRGASVKTLAHHIDVPWLREAYRRTRKGGARGVDGRSAEQYAAQLEDNLQLLLDRMKSGQYRAPPVRRVHIPKGEGSQPRPLGIPTFEDKVLQRAVVMVLEAVYEPQFVDGSYGFRPGRSAHQALDALRTQAVYARGGWVVELDIASFFDTVDHGRLREILRQRIRDGVLLRLIDKWLSAGVMEEGRLWRADAGTPQGGVISPLLANIYLHDVLDAWFEREVKPRVKGRAVLIRYADDAVMLFAEENEARRVLDVLPKRMGKYGLKLHPDKTRLLDFRRPDRRAAEGEEESKPGTFDLLGFTHYWGQSRAGKWVVKRKTATGRFTRALKRIAEWCREHRHLPVEEQWQALSLKLRGHFGYYGIAWNYEAIHRFREEVWRTWSKWLSRRSQRGALTQDERSRIQERYPLPAARLVRPTLAVT